MNNNEKIYWLAWSKIKGVGASSLKKIYDHFGSVEAAWRASPKEFGAIPGINQKILNAIIGGKPKINPENLYKEHLKKNPKFLTPTDEQYPQLLLEIPSPPPVLYYKGTINIQESKGIIPAIAIVGTRSPTEHGRRWTYNVSKALAQKGFTIVSGLAEGIDSYAHRGCLDGGGKTVAVLGNGLDRAYPRCNQSLMEEIAAKGLILTEYEYGMNPERGNFPARNRIIAGMCRAVLIMEAPEKSGALITAYYANEFNRDVYILPNSPDEPKARGCLRLIHNGAQVIISEEELLTNLGAIPQIEQLQPQQLSLFSPKDSNPQPNTPPTPLSPLSPKEEQVYGVIQKDPLPLDLIVHLSGLEAKEVSSILLQLELAGLISQLPGMMYCRC
ncbi:MAG: DNA-processing protein DprA [Geminocystis sp.]|nr:DNA-processing protein DprA [Geminocystis sp.]HIK37309.1 DNA-protecting protein DprA [Geminocystis sp. M7585_C2015_104]MCS7148264.1 DNA-processing protein DprA [Geminocystis sp.]MCX8077679.1 DNA-processing protein DprA [Geminocystis sp.]MDW8116571.1 DNA-processing protein DprA [Geminocystis sp.]